MEFSQQRALHLVKGQAERLLDRARSSEFIKSHGIELYLVEAPAIEIKNPVFSGTFNAVYIMVRAETDMACGMGVGFVTALSESPQ